MRVFYGARLFDGERFLDDHALVVEGAAIRALVDVEDRPRGGEEIDLGGGVLAPGFIDWPPAPSACTSRGRSSIRAERSRRADFVDQGVGHEAGCGPPARVPRRGADDMGRATPRPARLLRR